MRDETARELIAELARAVSAHRHGGVLSAQGTRDELEAIAARARSAEQAAAEPSQMATAEMARQAAQLVYRVFGNDLTGFLREYRAHAMHVAGKGELPENLRACSATAQASIALRELTREKASPEPPAPRGDPLTDPAATFTAAELRDAVNASCSCGGKGPSDAEVCGACLVWHRLRGKGGGATSGETGSVPQIVYVKCDGTKLEIAGWSDWPAREDSMFAQTEYVPRGLLAAVEAELKRLRDASQDALALLDSINKGKCFTTEILEILGNLRAALQRKDATP